MGFFNTVTYNKGIQDNSWYAKAESLADACRAPAKWVAAEVWGGGKTYKVTSYTDGNIECKTKKTALSEGLCGKVARVFAGAILAVPGFLLSIPLMSAAYLSEEIRLKHSFSVNKLSPEQKDRLAELIDKRLELADEKQGCEPISCMLVSIVCMLCCIVCAAE